MEGSFLLRSFRALVHRATHVESCCARDSAVLRGYYVLEIGGISFHTCTLVIIDTNALVTLTPVVFQLHFVDSPRCPSNSMKLAGLMSATGL
jgi:hypothetical protein